VNERGSVGATLIVLGVILVVLLVGAILIVHAVGGFLAHPFGL
jgi:hypothetical protein